MQPNSLLKVVFALACKQTVASCGRRAALHSAKTFVTKAALFFYCRFGGPAYCSAWRSGEQAAHSRAHAVFQFPPSCNCRMRLCQLRCQPGPVSVSGRQGIFCASIRRSGCKHNGLAVLPYVMHVPAFLPVLWPSLAQCSNVLCQANVVAPRRTSFSCERH